MTYIKQKLCSFGIHVIWLIDHRGSWNITDLPALTAGDRFGQEIIYQIAATQLVEQTS